MKPLRGEVFVVLLVALAASSGTTASGPAAGDSASLNLAAAQVAPNPRLFERVNEREQELFERIWARLDDPVRPENAVTNFALAQAFLYKLTSYPPPRDGPADWMAARTGPVISPAMEKRYGPAFVTGWYQRVLAWRQRNKPALMRRLGLDDGEADAVLSGHFRVGSPAEYALVAWGSPNNVHAIDERGEPGYRMFYTNGRIRQVLVSNGVVTSILD